MKSGAAQALLDSIDLTISDFASFSNASALEKSYLAKYLVVYISGVYEEVIETIINEMVSRNTSSSEIKEYVKGKLSRSFRNPNYENLKILIGDFGNQSWKQQVGLIPSNQIAALNSINSNKNAIAHGQSIILTLTDVIDYYGKSKPIIYLIDSALL